MVKVHYIDRLGNNLFQYAFGRIVAEQLNFKLVASAIPNFVNTTEPVEGLAFESPVVAYSYYDMPNMETIIADKTPRCIECRGWFQSYKYYAKHHEQIKHWFYIEPLSIAGRNDLVMHVRLGDFFTRDSVLDVEYYKHCIRAACFDRLHIFSDEPEHPYLRAFDEFCPNIVQLGGFETFRAMLAAQRIITSASTFSWWAAWLGAAEKIWCPVIDVDHFLHLLPRDDSRYEFINTGRFQQRA